jgi:predicted neuraminidase
MKLNTIMNKLIKIIFLLTLLLIGYQQIYSANTKCIKKAEFIYKAKDVPFPQCHASTIEETPEGLVAAWFGGTHEKHKDVGIWLSRQQNGKWLKPVEIVNGVINDTLRYPTWNPVLYFEKGTLILFYKVGPNCADWWGEMKTSTDNGKTWSKATRFADTIWGPIRNKAVLLSDGRLLCPSSTENNGWRVHMEWTKDLGKTWERTEALNGGDTLSAIQPTVLKHPNGKLQILNRTKSNKIYSSWSTDNGETWTKLTPIDLPNNNSGIDAVTLKDGRHLLIYNHIDRSKKQGKRNQLHLAISNDGLKWSAVCMVENDKDIEHEYSYPAIIQTNDGLVHITYTWQRKLIKHVVVNPLKITSTSIVNGEWPKSVK